jgi:O-antigen ligase
LRPRIWAVALERLRAAPWLGHGFGREIQAEAFIPAAPRGVAHPEVRHAHNVFLDVAIQLGIVGLAAFIALLGALALEYRRYLRDPAVAPLGIMGLALLAGFVVKNLTDDFFYRHNAVVFWAINGMLLGLARARRR